MIVNLRKHDGYRLADAKLQELKARRDELMSEERELAQAIAKPRDLQDEALALIHDSAVVTAVVTRDQLEQVQYELRVVMQAIEMQKRAADRERAVASELILERARPAYRAITKRIASILGALRDAAVDEYKLRHELIDADVSLTNDFICPFHGCGEPDDDGVRRDVIAQWLNEAKAAGAL
jgi:hypothetical protein